MASKIGIKIYNHEPRETYYIKRGRKYIPISEYDSNICDSIKHGTHLVVNHLGCRMYTYDVEPDHAAIIAATRIFKEYLVKQLHHASEARPKIGNGTLFTERQKKAYDKLKEELNEHTYFFEFPTLNDIAEKAINDFVQQYGKKYEDYPFVKKAYDNFLMKLKLCVDNQE
jgi:hypothetical protein